MQTPEHIENPQAAQDPDSSQYLKDFTIAAEFVAESYGIAFTALASRIGEENARAFGLPMLKGIVQYAAETAEGRMLARQQAAEEQAAVAAAAQRNSQAAEFHLFEFRHGNPW